MVFSVSKPLHKRLTNSYVQTDDNLPPAIVAANALTYNTVLDRVVDAINSLNFEIRANGYSFGVELVCAE